MSEPTPISSRILDRLAALGLSQREAARRAGIPESTLRNILVGVTDSPRGATLSGLARALNTTEVWLMRGEQEPPPVSEVRVANGVSVPAPASLPKDVPVLGTAAGSEHGKGAFQLTTDIVDYVRRPAGLLGAADAFALYVEGESMSPKFEPGDLVFVHPHRKPRPGDYVVIEEPETEVDGPRGFIKRLVSISSREVRVQQFNPRGELTFIVRPGLRVLKVILDGELYGV